MPLRLCVPILNISVYLLQIIRTVAHHDFVLAGHHSHGVALGVPQFEAFSWKQDFHLALAAYSLCSAAVICLQLLWYISLIRRYERTLS